MGWAIAEDTRLARAKGLQCLPAGAGEMLGKLHCGVLGCSHSVALIGT